jgi:hypothetical protein
LLGRGRGEEVHFHGHAAFAQDAPPCSAHSSAEDDGGVQHAPAGIEPRGVTRIDQLIAVSVRDDEFVERG